MREEGDTYPGAPSLSQHADEDAGDETSRWTLSSKAHSSHAGAAGGKSSKAKARSKAHSSHAGAAAGKHSRTGAAGLKMFKAKALGMAAMRCADGGPFACLEAGCPSDTINCSTLLAAGKCDKLFSTLWNTELAGHRVGDKCRRSCGTCHRHSSDHGSLLAGATGGKVARDDGETHLSRWYREIASTVSSDPILKDAYNLAAVVAKTNESRARELVKRVKGMVAMRMGTEMTVSDLSKPVATHVRPMKGHLSNCPKGEDYLVKLRERKRRWQNGTMSQIWQSAVDDKLIGYIYARSIGVRTPSVLWCNSRGYTALPLRWPKEWGCCFVIKPVYGYNDIGVMIVENGVDRFTGWPLRGREDAMKIVRYKEWIEVRAMSRTFIVETLIRGDQATFNSSAPTDYKFLVFGSTIGGVAVIGGRKSMAACLAWFDHNYSRQDRLGCACSKTAMRELHRCTYRHCPIGVPARPKLWPKMVRTASRLGELLGVHMRIDLFASSKGVVLGEFTPWHANGKTHCVVNVIKKSVRTPSGRGVLPSYDTCELGRLWNRFTLRGQIEGGPNTSVKTPRAIRNWRSLMADESLKCDRVVRETQPGRMGSSLFGASTVPKSPISVGGEAGRKSVGEEAFGKRDGLGGFVCTRTPRRCTRLVHRVALTPSTPTLPPAGHPAPAATHRSPHNNSSVLS